MAMLGGVLHRHRIRPGKPNDGLGAAARAEPDPSTGFDLAVVQRL